jgi:hypothetical protein
VRDQFPKQWEVIANSLDWALAYNWEDSANAATKAIIYATANKELVQLFLDKPSDLDTISECNEEYAKVPDELSRVMSTHIGKSLFSAEWAGVARTAYNKDYDRMLNELDNPHDFSTCETDVFETLCSRKATELMGLGHKGYEIIERTFDHLTREVEGYVNCPQDEWKKKFQAYTRTLAVSSRLVKLLPHEVLLFPAGVEGLGPRPACPRSTMRRWPLAVTR